MKHNNSPILHNPAQSRIFFVDFFADGARASPQKLSFYCNTEFLYCSNRLFALFFIFLPRTDSSTEYLIATRIHQNSSLFTFCAFPYPSLKRAREKQRPFIQHKNDDITHCYLFSVLCSLLPAISIPCQYRPSLLRFCSSPISFNRSPKNRSLTTCSLWSSHQS